MGPIRMRLSSPSSYHACVIANVYVMLQSFRRIHFGWISAADNVIYATQYDTRLFVSV